MACVATLSELVLQDYDAEVEIIKDAGGNVWLRGLGAAFCVAVACVIGQIFSDPWTKRDMAN